MKKKKSAVAQEVYFQEYQHGPNRECLYWSNSKPYPIVDLVLVVLATVYGEPRLPFFKKKPKNDEELLRACLDRALGKASRDFSRALQLVALLADHQRPVSEPRDLFEAREFAWRIICDAEGLPLEE